MKTSETVTQGNAATQSEVTNHSPWQMLTHSCGLERLTSSYLWSQCHCSNKMASERNSKEHLRLGLSLERPIQEIMQSGNFVGSLSKKSNWRQMLNWPSAPGILVSQGKARLSFRERRILPALVRRQGAECSCAQWQHGLLLPSAAGPPSTLATQK